MDAITGPPSAPSPTRLRPHHRTRRQNPARSRGSARPEPLGGMHPWLLRCRRHVVTAAVAANRVADSERRVGMERSGRFVGLEPEPLERRWS